MKNFLRGLTALFLVMLTLCGTVDYAFVDAVPMSFVQKAEAASANPNAYIVTWDKRTVKSGNYFAQSDNGKKYTAPLVIHYSNADKVRIRVINPKGKVVSKQDKTWKVKKSKGTIKFDASIPTWSAAGTYKVRVDVTKGKKTSKFTFSWRVTKYIHTAKPSSSVQKKFNYLKSKLPQGKYWNHGVKGTKTVILNNGAVTTISSARCDRWSHQGENFRSPLATCNYANNGYQCHGFAMLLATYVWGKQPMWGSMVSKKSAVYTLQPGDVVRFLNDHHTIFVLKVVKNTVYYADCNAGSPCIIRWNGRISVSELKKTFSYVYKYNRRNKQ